MSFLDDFDELPFPSHRGPRGKERPYFAGIDGEGVGRDAHRYNLLAWCNEDMTEHAHLQANPGESISTVECLEFILQVPKRARLFAYAFNYDLTKILTDVDDGTLYSLLRPDTRQRDPEYQHLGPRPVKWGDYRLNLVGTKFTVSRDGISKSVWDVFKFFQSKFTDALTKWKVADEADLISMREMKDKRGDFDKQSPKQILMYCLDECRYMAALARKLTEAHVKAGIKLTSYHGAGSTASAILKSMGIQHCERRGPDHLQPMIASAFFGGRFENSVIGPIEASTEKPIWSYDISSAYPYQCTFLPCLGHGHWKAAKDEAALHEDGITTALVTYSYDGDAEDWAPFPFRLQDGTICYPRCSGGGWLWRDEYLAGATGWKGVRFRGAWIYRTECQCQPFSAIPRYYVERLLLGKDGAGIAIKLGVNAVYGKQAQSKGVNPLFQSWLWAGMITSGCRAQLLQAIALHKNRANVLSVATDGIQTRERLALPPPRDTGTMTEHAKPLGGWEEKRLDGTMFYARPGIYFPVNPDGEDKAVKARGIGLGAMLTNVQAVIQGYTEGREVIHIANVTRFRGAKSSISKHAGGYRRSSRYGQWDSMPLALALNPLPKRQARNSDGTLSLRIMPGARSMPYKKTLSPEALGHKIVQAIMLEQPDGCDLTDYEGDT